jgi:hypothetical protein
VPGFGPIHTIEEDGSGTNWLSALGLPVDFELLETLAEAERLSGRRLRFA